MSYNKLNTYNFKINLNNNVDQNEVIYLQDNINNSIKNNSNFIIKNNTTFILKNNENSRLELLGKINLNENIYFDGNNNIDYLNLNDKISITYLSNLNKINIVNQQSNLTNIEFLSRNFEINNLNYFKSNNITGQFINDIDGQQLIQGSNGVLVTTNENNGYKFFEIEKNSFVENNLSLSPKDLINSFIKIRTTNIESTSSKDINNNYQFISVPLKSNISKTQISNNNTIARKYTHNLKINTSCKLWDIGKTFIYIDTTDFDIDNNIKFEVLGVGNNPSDPLSNLNRSRYQMYIDLRDREWKANDEITFFFKHSNELTKSFVTNKRYSINKKYHVKPNTTYINPTNQEDLMNNQWHILDLNKIGPYTPFTSNNYSFKIINSNLDFNQQNNIFIEVESKNDNITPQNSINSFNTSNYTTSNTNVYSNTYSFKNNQSLILTGPVNGIYTWVPETSISFYNSLYQNYIIKNGLTYYYQYIIQFPTNHRIFLKNKFNEIDTTLSNFNLTTAINNYIINWDTTTFTNTDIINTYPKTYNIDSIDQSSDSLLYNCLIFQNNSILYNNLNFTLKYIGNNDPSNPGIHTWIIV